MRLVTCDCYSAGDYRTQFHAKAAAIADALARDSYDFGFLHVKAVDDTGHDKLLALKVSYSELRGVFCFCLENIVVQHMQ